VKKPDKPFSSGLSSDRDDIMPTHHRSPLTGQATRSRLPILEIPVIPTTSNAMAIACSRRKSWPDGREPLS
jgi:hypothetical protein